MQAEILYQAAFVKSSRRMATVPQLLLAERNAQDFLVAESEKLKTLEPWSTEASRKRYQIWEKMFGSDIFARPENPDALLELGYSNLNLEDPQSLQALGKLGPTDEKFIGRGGLMVGGLVLPGQEIQQGILMLKDGAVGAFSVPNVNGKGAPTTFALRDITKCSVRTSSIAPIRFGEHIEFTPVTDPRSENSIIFTIQTERVTISFVSGFIIDGDSDPEMIRYLQGVAEYLFGMINAGIALNLVKR